MGNFGTAGSSYGPSSSCAASFVKTIKDAVSARLSSTRKQQSVASWEELKVLQPGQSAAEIFMLPPRKAADEMMEVYWHRFHVLFPFLCRPRFTSVYQSLWTGEYESINESSTYCLLNSIFAICCRFTKRVWGMRRILPLNTFPNELFNCCRSTLLEAVVKNWSNLFYIWHSICRVQTPPILAGW